MLGGFGYARFGVYALLMPGLVYLGFLIAFIA